MPSLGQLRHAGYIALFVASAAGSADVVPCEERGLPERDVAVGALFVGSKALAAMADGAAELGGDVRPESVMIAERFRRILEGWIVHAQVARGAAVDALQAREHYLVDLRWRG